MKINHYKSPIGTITACADNDALCFLDFEPVHIELDTLFPDREQGSNAVLDELFSQLDGYFSGKRREFDIPLKLFGTKFQQAVWAGLMQIPYGKTITYGQLAAMIGKPQAQRAVGGANHNNPISIIVPCHRVIGASGKLTGYGGGIDKKEYLLKLEGAI